MHATLLNNQSPSDILLYFYSEIFLKTILKEKLSVKAGEHVNWHKTDWDGQSAHKIEAKDWIFRK